MNKVFVNFICSFIVAPVKRKHWRFWLTEYNCHNDNQYIQAFTCRQIHKKTVLIVEPGDAHGELIPGIARYWLDLGYRVDILMHHSIAKDDPLCCFSHENLKKYSHSYSSLKTILRHPIVADYEVIFFNSSANSRVEDNNGRIISFLDHAELVSETNKNVFVVEHSLNHIDYFEQEKTLLKQGRLISLADFSATGYQTLMVNPHFFGDINITPKSTETINFIAVGKVVKGKKNHYLLLEAADSLIKNGVSNFNVTIVGGGGRKNTEMLQASIPQELQPFFTFTGQVDFAALYRYMEQADFFLPLLDPDIAAHERYVTTGVTGSYQLILGFQKPCLIDKKFADFYGFSCANSIIYSDLKTGMRKAISISDSDYSLFQRNIKELAGTLEKQSLENLKKMLTAKGGLKSA